MSSLVVKNISKIFEGRTIINNLNFDVSESELCFVFGENGIGKTTLIKILAGILNPDHGNITFNSKKIDKKEIGYISSNERSFFYRLTVKENLEYFSLMRGISRQEINSSVIKFSEIFKVSNKILLSKVMELSNGERKKISIMRAFIHKPSLLLFDEASDSLDMETKESFLTFLQSYILDHRDRVCIYASHSKNEILDFGSKCLHLKREGSQLLKVDEFKDIFSNKS